MMESRSGMVWNRILLVVSLYISHLIWVGLASDDAAHIPTTLEGPFTPFTVPFDWKLGLGSEDLPEHDIRVLRKVTGYQPEQVFLALSTTDAMWVSWVTGHARIGETVKPHDPRQVKSVVKFGTASEAYTFEAEGHGVTYDQEYQGEISNRKYTSGIIHHVRLTGLLPNMEYFYVVGDPSKAMSEEFRFTTMPPLGPLNYPKRIAVLGDLGLTYNSTTTIDHLRRNRPDLVLMIGDMSYADLYKPSGKMAYTMTDPEKVIGTTYQPRWDDWGRFMEPLTSTVPFMVIEGNHEMEQQVGETKLFASYLARFSVPSRESASKTNLYYSFNAGGIHFIMLGAYIDYSTSGEQYKWLEKDIQNVDRSITPWLVATWHAPWYTSYVAHYREVECMRQAMESLIYESGVDVVFNGHVHSYERMNRVYNYTLDPCAPVYITIGDGGNHEVMAKDYADENCPINRTGDLIGGYCGFNFTSGPAEGNYCWNTQPEWSAYREPSFGHGIVEVVNSTHLLWTWHRNQDAFYGEGDQIYIVRQPEFCESHVNRVD